MAYKCRTCGTITSAFNHCSGKLDWKNPGRSGNKTNTKIKQTREEKEKMQTKYMQDYNRRRKQNG